MRLFNGHEKTLVQVTYLVFVNQNTLGLAYTEFCFSFAASSAMAFYCNSFFNLLFGSISL